MSSYFEERVNQVHDIPLKQIIEAFGGTFKGPKNFYHPAFGFEKTPAAFIYQKNGKEFYKQFKHDLGGDAIDFVKEVCGLSTKVEAINKILGEDKNLNIISNEDTLKYKEQLAKEEKEKTDKERKRMFAILKNSVPIIESNLGVEYFINRGIDRTALTLRDKNIDIRINRFKGQNGKMINNIVYFFNGDEKKGTHKFMIIKGIDENANKNGVKLNIMTCRPIIHCEEYNKPFIVCEGIEDSLSALELGGYKNFISLNSTSSINKLILSMNVCRKWFTNNSLELCLDNDETGEKGTKKIKVFSNLVSMYENNELDTLKTYLEDKISSCKDDKVLSTCKYSLKLLGDTEDIRSADANIVLALVKNLTEILPEDYFSDYGKVFKVRESEYYGILKELGRNDLNEMLVKDYRASLDDMIFNIQKDNNSTPSISEKEYSR